MEQVTQEQLEACCREWQKRLRLQDWEVSVHLVDRGTMGDDCARVNRHSDYQSADIYLTRPEQYGERDTEALDWEHSLVHELLHIHLDAWEPEKDSREKIEQERAVNLIASALVGLKRETGRAVRGENPYLPEDYRKRMEVARGKG